MLRVLTLFALVSDATLERVELALQPAIQPLVVRTLPDEDKDEHDDDNDEDAANDAYDYRPPAGHRCASIRSRRMNVLQVTEIKEQVADAHLYTTTSPQTNSNKKCRRRVRPIRYAPAGR